MPPTHDRLDYSALLVRYLDEAVGHTVVPSAGAEMDPRGRPVTVVQVPSASQNGAALRWSFRVSITVTTFAKDPSAAYYSHVEVADGILNMVTLGGGSVRVSSVTADMEPADLTSATAPEWPAVVSSYTIFMRQERAN